MGVCLNGTCGIAPIEGCCTGDDQCEDNDPCTNDACENGKCINEWNGICCTTDDSCDDGNLCTTDACETDPNTGQVRVRIDVHRSQT